MKIKEVVVTIPRRVTGKSELVENKRQWEEKDTDEAIRVYLKEKKAGKLKILRSLADLD